MWSPGWPISGQAQVPWGLDALNGEVSKPAWKVKPRWYLVATDDSIIPVPAQRMMANRTGATRYRDFTNRYGVGSDPEPVGPIP